MTVERLKELFQDRDSESHHFERVEKKTSGRADLHAFELIDRLVPENRDLVCHAEHDQIWLGVGLEDLAAVINKEQVLELIRCGVWIDTDCLSMFV